MNENHYRIQPTMFEEFPDILTVKDLQEMLGIGHKAALDLAKNPQIHGVIIGNRFCIPKINVIRYLLHGKITKY